MTDEVANALANDRVIDITTTGRKSGEPRRIEIWFHRPRSWYANLVSHPEFTFHLKHSTTADLAATARPITEPAEREAVFGRLLPPLADLVSTPGNEPEAWIEDSPLVEVIFQP